MAASPATVTITFINIIPPSCRHGDMPRERSRDCPPDGAISPSAEQRRTSHPRNPLKRSELLTTVTELNAMAALASTGESRMPKKGYRIPAATGMPNTL